ncbi:CarD family transcriptional regulator [Actinoplanes sp. G11-F43]|uniref:CarD family transcriptional regulator n=1 Tax=Actinoplanes sp. G11-F43 TaxID=3424130 RepID=UPI003D324874
MNLEVGRTLVHPRHGAVSVTERFFREVKGVPTEFVTLTTLTNPMTISVPVDNVEMIGIRELLGAEQVDEVLAVLVHSDEDFSGNWSRRFKRYEELLASSDLRHTAHVVHNLWTRQETTGISPGEKRLLQKAMSFLTEELAQNEGIGDREAAEQRIGAALNTALGR